MESKVVNLVPVSPSISKILRRIGIPFNAQREKPKRMKRPSMAIQEILKENRDLPLPKAIYQFFDYRTVGNEEVVLFDRETREEGEVVFYKEGIFTSRHLVENCILKFVPQRVALLVVTAGFGISDKIKELDDSEENWSTIESRRLYLDAIGSETVEAAVRYVCAKLTKECNCRSYRRFSSGLGETQGFDWQLSEQKVLFKLIGKEAIKDGIGVELLEEELLMVPVKTVSAIFFPFRIV